jgi:hypothetical protein
VLYSVQDGDAMPMVESSLDFRDGGPFHELLSETGAWAPCAAGLTDCGSRSGLAPPSLPLAFFGVGPHQGGDGGASPYNYTEAGTNAWMQLDLGAEGGRGFDARYAVVGAVTQGRDSLAQDSTAQWVTRYRLEVDTDGAWSGPMGGDGEFSSHAVVAGDRSDGLFTGNTDQDTKRFRYLDKPVEARLVRFYPV